MRAWEFVRDAGGWGLTSTLASSVTFGFGIYQSFTGNNIAGIVLLIASVPLFWAGSLIAWNKKANEVEQLITQVGSPDIILDYIFANDKGDENQNFRLINRGEDAYEIQINELKAGAFVASFEVVDHIFKNDQVTVKPHLDRPASGLSPVMIHYIWLLFGAAGEEQKALEAKIDFAVTYKGKGRTICYSTEGHIVWNAIAKTARTRIIKSGVKKLSSNT